jgi:hypothetical protein
MNVKTPKNVIKKSIANQKPEQRAVLKENSKATTNHFARRRREQGRNPD